MQQEFAQISGEGGLEAADGGETAGDGAVGDEPRHYDLSAADSGDDSGSSNASSDGKPRLHASLGVEVSTQDKEIMIKTFLDGKDSWHAPEVDHVADEIAKDVEEMSEQPPDTKEMMQLSSAFDFGTPPTKLRTGSVDPGVQNADSLAQNTGDQRDAAEEPPSQMKPKTRFQRQASEKSASSSKKRAETCDAAGTGTEENSGSQDGGTSRSERNQRDRKMALIVVLCASAFIIFNAAAYLYLGPVKIGSVFFDELNLLLDIQAQLDLPKSRFFPILLHIVGLMNPSLIGLDRQIQTEHLGALIIEFKDSLTHHQQDYGSNAALSSALKAELSIGMKMFVLPCLSYHLMLLVD